MIEATFGTIANRAVTGVGAPSYTSGVHIWKGAADILNARPESRNTIPTVIPIEISPVVRLAAISLNLVLPEKPYIMDAP